MDTDTVVAIVGALAAIAVAWIQSKPFKPAGAPSNVRSHRSELERLRFIAYLAVGLALTALVAGIFSVNEAWNPQFNVQPQMLAAATEGYDTDPSLQRFIAPVVEPARPEQTPAKRYVLDAKCDKGSKPIAAWHEITTSHPSIDGMYSILANVEAEQLVIYLRARKQNQYAYVKVLTLCGRQ